MNTLEIDNIELSFGKNEILKSVYFKAERGKITGILGSNGSGKTSLLRILFGELKPTNKLIRIDYKPILTPLYAKGLIHYLPQFNFIPSYLSVEKAFSFYEVKWQSFIELFPSLISLKNIRFGKLSGGEKRLVEVYISIHSKSEIVLLDEPFSYLAPVYSEILKQEIVNVKQDKCIIVTDHLYQKILDISDDLYLLREGYSKKIEVKEDLIRYNYVRSL